MTQKNNLTAIAKIIFAIFGNTRIAIVAGTAFILVAFSSCLFTGESHNKTYLISHFKNNYAAFYGLRDYADAVDPDQNVNQLEFYLNQDHEVYSLTVNGKYEFGGSKSFDSWIPTDSLLRSTKWTKKDFITVCSKLKELGFSGFKRGEPFTLIFDNNGSNELYHIYKKPVQKDLFLDNPCNYYVLDQQVILEHIYITEWGGTDCFTDEPNYSKDFLVSHFEDNRTAFNALRDYALEVDTQFSINQLDFNIDNTRGIFSIKVNGKEEKGDFQSIESWLPTDSLSYKTKWTKKDFVTVYAKLNELKCSGIKIGEPFSVVFNNKSGCHDLFHLYKYPVTKDRFLRAPSLYFILNDGVILEHIREWGSEYCYYK